MLNLTEIIQNIYRDGVVDTCETVPDGESLKKCDDRSTRPEYLTEMETKIIAAIDPWTKVEEGLPVNDYDKKYRVWVLDDFNKVSHEVHARYFKHNWWQGYNPASLLGHVIAFQPITAPGE